MNVFLLILGWCQVVAALFIGVDALMLSYNGFAFNGMTENMALFLAAALLISGFICVAGGAIVSAVMRFHTAAHPPKVFKPIPEASTKPIPLPATD